MGDEISKKGIIFYDYWAEELLSYPDDLRHKISDAIMKYQLIQEIPTDREVLYSIFGIIKRQIDLNTEKYLNICERNRKNGAKGGRPRKTQENPLGYLETQENPDEPKKAKYKYEDKNKDNFLESNKLDSSSTLQVDPNEPLKRSSKSLEINYTALGNFFNALLEKNNSTIPRIQRVTDRRKTMIEARCREYGKEAIQKALQNASTSDFLNGRNDNGWVADFDWIFKPNNFPKVLEGNYNQTNSNSIKNDTNKRDKFSRRRGIDTSATSPKDYEEPL